MNITEEFIKDLIETLPKRAEVQAMPRYMQDGFILAVGQFGLECLRKLKDV